MIEIVAPYVVGGVIAIVILWLIGMAWLFQNGWGP